MQRRWWFSLLIVLAVGLLAAVALRLLPARQEPPVSSLLANLTLDAPKQVAAGEPFTVAVSADPPLSGLPVLLTARGTSGLYAESQPLQDGVARFALPEGWSQAAGVVTLAAHGGSVTASRTITITAGAAANPLFAMTGAASVAIDSGDTPVLAALPLDVFGNPLPAGTEVIVRSQPPSSSAGRRPAEMARVLTRDLLAVARLATQTAAGLLTAAARSEAAHSLTQSVRITPAEVQEVVIQARPQSAPAGSSVGVRLETGPLADAYGNLLPDGVAVFFVTESSDGSRGWLPAVTVSGRAAAVLAAPPAAATVAVQALVGAGASEPITVTFSAPPQAEPFALNADVQGAYVTLHAGPLLGDLDALVPDGRTVTFVLSGPDGRRSTHTAVTHYGVAEAVVYVGDLPPGLYQGTAFAGEEGRPVGAEQAQTTFSLPGGTP